MLEYGILLELIRTTTVIEADQIRQGNAPVENLPTNKNAERAPKLKLTCLIEQR